MSGPEVQLWTQVFSHALCLQKRAVKENERVTLRTLHQVLTPTLPSAVSLCLSLFCRYLTLAKTLIYMTGVVKPITSRLCCKLNKLRCAVFTLLPEKTMAGSKGAGGRTKGRTTGRQICDFWCDASKTCSDPNHDNTLI